jgi:hypothetical protein
VGRLGELVSDEGAPGGDSFEIPLGFKFGEGSEDCVSVDFQVGGELSRRRQPVAGADTAAPNIGSDGFGNYLKKRNPRRGHHY